MYSSKLLSILIYHIFVKTPKLGTNALTKNIPEYKNIIKLIGSLLMNIYFLTEIKNFIYLCHV